MISIHERSTQLSNQIINLEIPTSSWFFPGVISSTGAIVGLTLARGFDSKALTLISGAIGVASIFATTELASDKLLEASEKINPLFHLIKQSKMDTKSSAKELYYRVKRLEFLLKSFITSLEEEQVNNFSILLGEHQILGFEPSTEKICLHFGLSQKQLELLNRYSEFEKGSLKGFEIICKMKSAGKKIDLIKKFLKLEGKQKILFDEFAKSLEESNEEILYQIIQIFYQNQLSSDTHNYLKTLNYAQIAFAYAAPFASIFQLLHRITFQPLSSLFAIGSWSLVLMGAMAASYIFYQCIYLNYQENIKAKASEIYELNKL